MRNGDSRNVGPLSKLLVLRELLSQRRGAKDRVNGDLVISLLSLWAKGLIYVNVVRNNESV